MLRNIALRIAGGARSAGLSRHGVASSRQMSTQTAGPSVDVHTHMYFPRYTQMLRDRNQVPLVTTIDEEERLLILPGEENNLTTAAGRPFGEQYYSLDRKIAFMDAHNIRASVLSLPNPWLDFLSVQDAVNMASYLNDDLQKISEDSDGRLYGFGVLPLKQDVQECAKELRRIATMDKMKGVIMSTSGSGYGLDDPVMDPIWEALNDTGLIAFLHPHEGVGNDSFGTEYGHSLFLAMGFTFETSVAATKMILSGVMERHQDLKVLLAHAGGTLPFLSGRLDNCVKTDERLQHLKHLPSVYLKRMYYDSISYHNPALDAAIAFAGGDRLMFGTDHPFFPPPDQENPMAIWPSTQQNLDILRDTEHQAAIERENAQRILKLMDLP
eukprot:GFYU01005923.1.p1 GENE.GFYU01005923.1~~GFYU01005923.1.p1  ORF type:complete len:383 (-),score=87.98 GFYU01005923.1:440-1588(-)